jgi:hypothetical protein
MLAQWSEMIEIKKYVTGRIEDELCEGKIDNAHGITAESIERHLVDPVIQIYISDSRGEVNHLDLWTVLEEDSIGRSAYKVFFDPETNDFGLGATDSEGRLIYLGNYGSFLDALNGM